MKLVYAFDSILKIRDPPLIFMIHLLRRTVLIQIFPDLIEL